MEQNKNKKPLLNHVKRKFISSGKGQIIGVTGSIATGKSFVLACLKQLGFEVFNTDEAVHKLLLKDGKAFEPVSLLCPEAVGDEGIDRKILGEKVFANPEKLKLLEGILHPLVRQAQVDFAVSARKDKGRSIVFEVPLLFENKREKFYDHIIVTVCPPHVQKERALSRKNMTEEKFNAILKLQMADALKIKKADFVIKTGKTPEDTIKQIRNIIFDATYPRNNLRYRDNRPNKKRPPN